MSCYFIAQITIEDEEEYGKYLAECDDVFTRFNGEYLAVDSSPKVLEGSFGHGRVVLIRFPCEEDLLRWYQSPEYQEILKHRLNGARCDTVIVNG
jgi:uncharacterized protein (DUF1330 family)